jgi:hypothetical protein
MSDSRPDAATTITATLAIPPNALQLVAPPPETISQRNVEAVTGIPARVYLEAVRSPAFPLPVARLGKLRIVGRAAFVAWLEKGGFHVALEPGKASGNDEPLANEPIAETADDILAAVGLKAKPSKPEARKGGRARRS